MSKLHAYAAVLSLVLMPASARADVWDAGAATNDNTASATQNELVHGLEQVHDLAARAGTADDDYFVLNHGLASFEAIVDSTSADVGGLFAGPNFVRLDDAGTAVVQESVPVWSFLGDPGNSRALRWRVGPVAGSFRSFLRVRATCAAACTSQDTYRLRFYDTTLAVPRFNNAGTQSTVLLVQNTTENAVAGNVYFFDASGALLHDLGFTVPRFGTLVANTAAVTALQGRSGSALVVHDAGYGQLAGKAVSLDPSTGFALETPLTPRPR